MFCISQVATRNLNRIIDINYYPIPEARKSNMRFAPMTDCIGFACCFMCLHRVLHRHRPIGLGVQGLADTFILMRYPFESAEAKLLNKQVLCVCVCLQPSHAHVIFVFNQF